MKFIDIDRAIGVWYGLRDSEVHSSLQTKPIFEDLSKEKVEKAIAAHDKFREELYEILTDREGVSS